MIDCARKGEVITDPAVDIEHNNWKFNVAHDGFDGWVTITVALDRDERGNVIIVVTTYREE